MNREDGAQRGNTKQEKQRQCASAEWLKLKLKVHVLTPMLQQHRRSLLHD
jgi:hypothetical protein